MNNVISTDYINRQLNTKTIVYKNAKTNQKYAIKIYHMNNYIGNSLHNASKLWLEIDSSLTLSIRLMNI